MATTESNGNNKSTNKIGLYVHKESGAEVIASSDIQGDAFVRLGFEHKGEVPAKKAEDKKETK
jgi:hypothetical protein